MHDFTTKIRVHLNWNRINIFCIFRIITYKDFFIKIFSFSIIVFYFHRILVVDSNPLRDCNHNKFQFQYHIHFDEEIVYSNHALIPSNADRNNIRKTIRFRNTRLCWKGSPNKNHNIFSSSSLLKYKLNNNNNHIYTCLSLNLIRKNKIPKLNDS